MSRSLRSTREAAPATGMIATDSGVLPEFTFSVQGEEVLRDKGCFNVFELTRNVEDKRKPIWYFKDKMNLTPPELERRLDMFKKTKVANASASGVPQPFHPFNCVEFDPLSLKAEVLENSVLERYTPYEKEPPCCSCTDKCEDSCSCRDSGLNCYHVQYCHNTSVRRGILPPTYICHSGNDEFKLGVRAGQDMPKGTFIMPFFGKFRSRTTPPNDYQVLLQKSGVTKTGKSVLLDPVPYGGTSSFVNDGGESSNTNVELVELCNTVLLVFVANTSIKEDDWLSFDYSASYFETNKESSQERLQFLPMSDLKLGVKKSSKKPLFF